MASITQPFVRVIRAGLRRYRQRNEIREEKENLARYNEAVELVKKYGAEEDYQFVNGLLGSVAREAGLAAGEDGGAQEEPAQP